ncbi:prepilin-type N-terminal cleavage/methylation domain-containing protein [Vibrio coralliilyticus]|uniref:PilW family protein n=1 Tax=Vibrio coralliilyticus TaxID=190893 RepID=UPI000BAC1D1F|nr:prepilin-type N-terminal cleavage/methylation domain-containing protein [Vibrio coralliilyticus]NOI76674.1 prepilin-type N-terminal cleavage/methylation domain-containing protein [Vibrio coralliilyticus]PAW03394.1 pilus assembly protein PilW [Vibrio coralliilyticus]
MLRGGQPGYSLIELLVSTSISLIVIAIAVTMLLHSQRLSVAHAKELMLLQSTNSVLQMMKLDLYRAGHGGVLGESVRLSGAAQTYYVKHSEHHTLLAFAYLSGSLESETAYANVVYQRQSESKEVLRVCAKKLPRAMSALEAENFTTHFGNTCNTVFDSNLIVVTEFELESVPLTSAAHSSSLLNVELSTYLRFSPEVSNTLAFSIKQRNW